jgi:hypothetical protein
VDAREVTNEAAVRHLVEHVRSKPLFRDVELLLFRPLSYEEAVVVRARYLAETAEKIVDLHRLWRREIEEPGFAIRAVLAALLEVAAKVMGYAFRIRKLARRREVPKQFQSRILR